MWNVAEILLRSLSAEVEPRVDRCIHRTVEEDEFRGASNQSREEISIERTEVETLSSNPVGNKTEVKTDDEKGVMNSFSDCQITGKCSILVLSTIMETSEEDDTDKVKTL